VSDITLDIIKDISITSPSKIVLLVMDGLGGLPDPRTGKTELETARTFNLDQLAAQGNCGLSEPVAPGVTPGSAPGHLSLFGYDPLIYSIKRGVLEAVGIDFDLMRGDVAARGNFCTIDDKGLVTDRRAGRVSDGKCAELAKLLDGQVFDGVKVLVQPVREHRFVAVFRGDNLVPEVTDSDPLQTGAPPKKIEPLAPGADRLAKVANQFLEKARAILASHYPANMALLRGFSKHPDIPTISEIYKLKPAAIASYPMYRGLAKLVGMEVLRTGKSIEEEFQTLKQNYGNYDYFFIHVKGTDTAGEDGNFDAKVRVIEQFDRALPQVLSLSPDVIIVTGDHSTPTLFQGHSWHPVPFLIHSKWCRPDGIKKFGERACASGSLGTFPAKRTMLLAMAHAVKLTKYGA